MNRFVSTHIAAFVGLFSFFVFSPPATLAQKGAGSLSKGTDKFRQLEDLLPTPGATRTASGAPGDGYWQQQADYDIDVELDDQRRRIVGKETITYHNRSPHSLGYLWLQLDPNLFARGSDSVLSATVPFKGKDEFSPGTGRVSFDDLRTLLERETFDGRVNIRSVTDEKGRKLKHAIVKTMMRVDLPRPLESGDSYKLRISWDYKVVNAKLIFARGGYEYFEKDKNCLYEIAQWFPRMAAYTDVNGWQHKQFLGRGEFTLEMGDYLIRITVPEDHVVAATGQLLNEAEVLTDRQRERFKKARTSKDPVFIITPEEANENESKKKKPSGKKTWIFKANHVRDFAFASSRKFIWDAMGHNVDGNRVMAMSFYPNEGEPLWSRYSTRAVAHTLNVYSKYLLPYPYPVAISVNGPVKGMEYPMICFNGPRPEKDGTYSARTKYGLISVVIHEVGHNWFPMIINSDERQWTWMDEGLNTFMQTRAEQEWEEKYPSRRGVPHKITSYMTSRDQVPIMTNSESIHQFSNNAYAKTATALTILRDTVLGRKLFDFALKQYAHRWRFKRPTPADFFRTMEDASGVDLDWFFRGWFYTTDHVDISIDSVKRYRVNTRNPDVEKKRLKALRDETPQTPTEQRDKKLPKRIDELPELKDFYNDFDALDVTEEDRREYQRYVKSLSKESRRLLKSKQNFYVIDFTNIGGLVMPLVLEIEYADESKEELRIPAEVWRFDSSHVSKLLVRSKEIKSLALDPRRETADTDRENNRFPRRVIDARFRLFKERTPKNPMQRAKEREERKSAEKKKAE